jgi:Tol biopolymer transport system component/DNA-binding winged helix-turn-helix (wHTH) protein
MVPLSASPLEVGYRFGSFTLNRGSGDLARNGRPIRLQEKPRSLLLALAARPGELITRAELHERLWPHDTFVDFEDGLNAAMSKLREALGDTIQSPRYIETVRGRGYRFIAVVREQAALSPLLAEDGSLLPPMQTALQTQSIPTAADASAPTTGKRSRQLFYLAMAGVAAAACVVAAVQWSGSLQPPRMLRLTQITTQGKIDFLVKPVTDGARIFYMERSGGHWNAMETSLQGGVPQQVPGLPPNTRVMDLSPDHTRYLLGTFTSRSSGSSLSFMPVQGGGQVRLNDIESGEAVWHPDGKHIVYAKGNELWSVASDGTNARRITSLPGTANWLAWSPDGKRLRLTVGDGSGGVSLWETRQDGSGLHRLLLDTAAGDVQCCGEWTTDGRYFIFTSTHGNHSSLWAVREPVWQLLQGPRGPFQIIDWPTASGAFGAHVTPDGHGVLFYSGSNRSQIVRLDVKSGALIQISAEGFSQPDYSADGNWLIDVDANTGALWKTSRQASQRLQLNLDGFVSNFPRWSPDGRQIAVAASQRGAPATTYLIPANGGTPKLLLPNVSEVVDPDWSPDGRSLVVAHGIPKQNQDALFLVDLSSRNETLVPHSQGYFLPHWSPDGHYLAAYGDGGHSVEIYDFATRQWQIIVRGAAIGFPVWTSDSRYLVYQEMLEEGEPIYRYDMRQHAAERIADFDAELSTGISRCALMGLAPDGAPLLDVTRGNSDLFRAELSLPR